MWTEGKVGSSGKVVLSIIAVLVCAGISFGHYSGGTGDANDPYRIGTAADLNDISNHEEDYDKYFVMVADIDMGGLSFDTAVIAPDSSSFSGVFDGNDHIVSNINIDAPTSNLVGLFGYIGSNGEVKNLGVEDVNIIGFSYVGGLCGRSWGTINNCYSTGDVSGGDYIGGLCGEGDTTSNCYSKATVTGRNRIGGLCGHGRDTTSNCYSTGVVSGDDNVGGLCGYNQGGAITDCCSTAIVSGDSYVGGLCGYNWVGRLSNCSSTGSVSGGVYIGGLCGKNFHQIISDCYSTSIVSGGSYTGGLCGENEEGTIINCYSMGSVEGYNYVGGLCGISYEFNGEAIIVNCYSTGSVSGTSNVGGLLTTVMTILIWRGRMRVESIFQIRRFPWRVWEPRQSRFESSRWMI